MQYQHQMPVVEAYVRSTVITNKFAPVIPRLRLSRQKWIEEQSKDPNIGKIE